MKDKSSTVFVCRNCKKKVTATSDIAGMTSLMFLGGHLVLNKFCDVCKRNSTTKISMSSVERIMRIGYTREEAEKEYRKAKIKEGEYHRREIERHNKELAELGLEKINETN